MRFPVFIVCLLLLCCGVFAADIVGEANELQLTADDTQFDTNSNLFKATGNVKLLYGKLTLTADEMTVNRETMDFAAKGNVQIVSEDGGKWSAPAVAGNLDKKSLKFGPYRLDTDVWHSAGDGGENVDEHTMGLDHLWVSTCDLHEPHYRLTASSIKYHDDHTFSAKHVVLKFWKVPVFYFPYLWGNTDGTSGFIIRPGYSGKRGAYLRFGRIWRYAENGKVNLFTDLMSKRGIGLGSESENIVRRNGQDIYEYKTNLYGLLDSRPPHTEHGYDRRFKETDERYRVNGYYRREFFGEELTLRANLDVLSDISMLEDWFKGEYRRVNQPKTFIDLSTCDYPVDFGLSIRPRVNDFYTVVQTLPEYHLDIARIDIKGTPLQYQSSTLAGYYSMKWRDFDRKRSRLLPDYFDKFDDLPEDPSDYESWRLHSQHFIYLPISLGDAAMLTPRAGVAGTYYSRSSRRKVSKNDLASMFDVDNPDRPYSESRVVNYDGKGGEVMRVAYEFGAELRTAFYSDKLTLPIEALDITDLVHVVEPYINYNYMPEPSHDRDHLYYFDDIDRLEQQHFIRLGIDQRLVTTRENVKDTVIRLQSYVDFHFDRGEDSGRHPADFGARLDFSPKRELNFWAASVHDIGEGDIQRGETGLRLGKEDEFNLSIRYIYRNEHISRSTYSLGSSLTDIAGESGYLKKRFESADVIVGDVEIPINSITTLAISAEYDFEKSRLSEHKYQIRRRLHCWDMAFGFGWDNSDFEMMLMFQLVAFPKIKLDLSM
ncbi:MAG: LPS assembly protein LptD [Victivallales bacterium]|nr:LPS assembly protein LptD [Victivallales bacterium]